MTAALVLLLVGGSLAAIALAFVRILRGPSQADRIIALDVIFAASIALTAAAALATGRALFLDIGIGLAIVGFVATVVWARLIDKSPRERQ
jgi:multicomponent Na+:H+ antiporter subunit F